MITRRAHVEAVAEGPTALAGDATTWDGLSRAAFASDWDPETAIAWSRPIEIGAAREAWIEILQEFYEGEWPVLERRRHRARRREAAPAVN